ncbi:MAG: hypothetical protein KatS3mg019_2483 [Fimbriimonadales bacterium]|nr:MAG: hypothetical protein KatS3mg019_2483 [Fimbriimonadales bacterium]
MWGMPSPRLRRRGVGYDSNTMRTLEEVRFLLRQHQHELRERYGVKSLRIFGSYARGEQTPESDIDLLAELDKPLGLRFFELWDYLESILQTRVDLMTPGALRRKPRLQQRIQEDLVNV